MNDRDPAEYYDIDQGRKTSLARSVELSPRRYAQSNVPRFKDTTQSNLPFGVYNLDTANRKTIESTSRDSRQFYSCFQSKTQRFRPWSCPVTDVFYDTERLKNYDHSSLVLSMDKSPIKYSILHSRYKRFPDKPNRTEAPDVEYDIDRGSKATLVTATVESPVVYANLKSKTTRFKQQQTTSTPNNLGPGSYDSKYVKDVSVSSALDKKPLSTLQSTSSRFYNDRPDPSKNLGSTWRQDWDDKHWKTRSVTISKAEYLRPQYLPKAYKGK